MARDLNCLFLGCCVIVVLQKAYVKFFGAWTSSDKQSAAPGETRSLTKPEETFRWSSERGFYG